MTGKYLKRRFTLRESILMIVLAVIVFFALFFWLVFQPIQKRYTALEGERENLSGQLLYERNREQNYDKWKAELEAYLQADDVPQKMPKFDNKTNLMNTFTEILGGMTQGITYEDANMTATDGIYERRIRFVLTVNKSPDDEYATCYDKVRDILYKLTHTEYRSQLKELSVTSSDPLETAETITVGTTIVFYELA